MRIDPGAHKGRTLNEILKKLIKYYFKQTKRKEGSVSDFE